jgi:hypothetical protein
VFKISLIPREQRFFRLLHSSATNATEVSIKLVDLMYHYEDVPAKVAEIMRLEEVGDGLIHEIMTQLHRTFVTPLDRDVIANLGERLDDVVDSIEDAARHIVEYRITAPTPTAQELARIILDSARQMEAAISLLHFRGSKLREILPHAIEVNRLENEADHITSRAMADLFNNGTSAIEVLKWREIYGFLEGATDRCEDVANVLEGIVLENA